MAIIEKKVIISTEAENFAAEPIKGYKELIDLNEKLVKSAKELQDAYRQIAKSNDGKEAKNLVTINNELIKTNKELINVDKALEQLEQAKQKTEQSLIKTKKDQIALTEKEAAINAKKIKQINDESSAYRKLSSELTTNRNKWKDLAAQNKENTKEANELLKKVIQLDAQLKKIDNTVGQNQRSVGKYTDALKGMGRELIGGLGITMGIAGIINLGKSIVTTRAEFQKYAIVLENSLGSAEKAAKAMKMIEDFAARTPFSVAELTASYIKLVNQGFKPTEAEMTKLGDLASSTGKSFDQLTEAIIDAGAFEFERLKEFGIRAKKVGDQITFTFKNQETTVKASNDAIRQYLLSLGELPGVLGANEKISKGLTGQLSNMGDAWDRLLNALGGGSEGAISKSLSGLSKILEDFTVIVKSADEPQTTFLENLKNWGNLTRDFLDPLFLGLLSKMEKLTGIADRDAKKKAEAIQNEKNAIGALISEKDRQAAIDRGIAEAQIEYYELHKNDNVVKKESIKLTDAEIKSLQAAKLAEEQYNFELERRLNLKMQEIDNPEISPLKALGVTTENPLIQAAKDVNKNIAEINQQYRADELKRDSELIDAKKELQNLFIEESTAFASEVFSNDQDAKIASIQDAAKAEEQILKDKLDKGVINETQYNQQITELNRKTREQEAKAEKKKAIFDIAIATAVAAIKALAVGVPPFNWINAAKITAEGLIKSAFVAARPIPKFAKGEINIQGKSHSQGGILAEIEGGESVVSKLGTKNAPETLEAINKGLFTDRDIKKAKTSDATKLLLSRLNMTNERMLTAILNGVYQYTINGITYTTYANGSHLNKQFPKND